MRVKIIAINVILIMVLSICFPGIKVLATEKDSSEIITGTYQFASDEGSNIQSQNTFEYRDDCFTRSSYLGCKHLEILSIQTASASVSYYGAENDKYEIDPTENAHNIIQMLEKMKFNDVTTNKYYTTEKHENSMGVVVGHKNIIQDGKSYTLLAIFPRSAGYKAEWAGNFTVGSGDIHDGFKQARDEILRYVKKYIVENNIKGDLKVWTAGWSRGAAITNMLGGFFAGGGIEYFGKDVSITSEDVYCYTIGTPKSIKNGLDKNIELSVSGNREGQEYIDDTPGEPFQYTKGGNVTCTDSIYGGIRSINSSNDFFSLLPPEEWGFTTYGQVISSNQSLASESEMLEELKSISPYVYNQYTDNGKIKQLQKKNFDLKTLSIVDCNETISLLDFLKQRIKGMEDVVKTNMQFEDEHYQDGLKAFAGVFGMTLVFLTDTVLSGNIEMSNAIETLAYTYLAYASEELQKEGRAVNETKAIAKALEELLTYFTGQKIDNATFTVDDFIQLFAKYISDNENEPISDALISGIVSLIPEGNEWFLNSFKNFDKNNTPEHEVTAEEGIKAFIKACYYGADPECYYAEEYSDALSVRSILGLTMVFALSADIPEISNLLMDKDNYFSGRELKFEDAVGVILEKIRTVKDEEGNVIKTYSNMSELADDTIVAFLDKFIAGTIEKSEELYGEEYKNELANQANALKDNITKAREIISSLILYTDGGFNTEKMIENAVTLVDNASLIPVIHYNELYLALARTSDRYEEHYIDEETNMYECIEGNGQIFDNTNDSKLSFKFNIDYDEFIENGKVFIDNNEVSRDNYVISKGSTIITFNDDFVKTIGEGEHTLIAQVNEENVPAEFTISNSSINEIVDKISNNSLKASNPQTGDNIISYVIMFVISTLGVISVNKIKRKSI